MLGLIGPLWVAQCASFRDKDMKQSFTLYTGRSRPWDTCRQFLLSRLKNSGRPGFARGMLEGAPLKANFIFVLSFIFIFFLILLLFNFSPSSNRRARSWDRRRLFLQAPNLGFPPVISLPHFLSVFSVYFSGK